jgi:PAS domain S-box-containing protein
MRLMALRNSAAEQRVAHTKTALIFGTLLGLLITTAAGWSTWRDGSRRGQAEEALAASEERYRRLLDGVQDYAIFMLDPVGKVVSWNAGAERIKGHTAAQIIGRNFSCFFPPEDMRRGRPEGILRITSLTGRHEERGVRMRRDGSQFAVDVTLTALRDSTGKLLGFSKVSRDLSASSERTRTLPVRNLRCWT